MAGKWAEGFESHRQLNQAARKYATTSGNMSIQAGRVFGFSGAPQSNVWVTPSLGNADTWIIGFGFRLASHNTNIDNSGNGLYFEDGASEQFHIGFLSTSGSGVRVQLFRGATLIGETADFDFGVWHYFEVKVTINDTTGAYEIRRNGVQVLTGNGNTALNGNGGADVFAWRFSNNLSSAVRFDDVYVCDDSGASNNDFLGPRIIEAIEVTANGDTNQWVNDNTSVVGVNNFQQVDDAATSTPDENGSGGTISSDTNGDLDLFTMSDLQQITGTVSFVHIGVQAAMAAAGLRTLRFKYSDGATVADGPSFVVNAVSYDEFTAILDTNPVTSAAWDVSGIDGGQFGVEVVS